MSLSELQQLFWRAITWPTGIDDFLAQADERTRASFDRIFVGSERFDARSRMQVYAEAYFWRLFEVLREQYERTAWLCTPSPFHDLVTDYVLAHPSTDPDISSIGRGFPQYVRGHVEETRRPGLSGVALVEWTIFDTLDRADEPALAPESLARVPLDRWPSLRFIPRNTTTLVPCRLPFGELARAHERGASPPEPGTEGRGGAVLAWRHGFEVFHRAPEAPEARALHGLIQGERFAGICDAAAGPRGDQARPETVVRWLHRWLTEGVVGDILDPEDPAQLHHPGS